ncbi:MAG: right-handed parallel beta-helix repeat-containing protein [Alphaproteobacteria bacterium]|nr:right-handed parallel beta-helix repeat-containing protein [Alphaproteobacteria bacterium]MCB9795701.1 right-handed parallel beta-helix repeat-containing protein [Alphaproteobacteria bacterium]
MSLFALTLLACSGGPEAPAPVADADFQKQLQEQLILAKPGDVIEVPEGTWQLDRGLSLSVDGVTVRGAGINKTVLSFKGQAAGAEGLLVTGDDFTIEDIALEDTAGDALKIKGAKGVTIRRVRTEWTGGADEENGAYGIYPVQCERVLIEDSVAIGASDAGIYVGQSEQIVVRRNRAEQNVAGIEIENSKHADVYENVATGNTGGILVFDLPDLPARGGRATRVFNNTVRGNNHDNFAPEGNIVGLVPPGTGVLIMANDDVQVFDNVIEDHDFTHVAIASYIATQKPIKDAEYDPYPEAITVRDNKMGKGGENPRGLLLTAMSLAIGTPVPHVVWDGIVNKEKLGPDGALPEDQRICVQNNGDGGVINLDARNDFANPSKDPAPFDCSHPPLAGVDMSTWGGEAPSEPEAPAAPEATEAEGSAAP